MGPLEQRIFDLLWPHRPPTKDDADMNRQIEIVASKHRSPNYGRRSDIYPTDNLAFIVRWTLTPIGHEVDFVVSIPVALETVLAVYIHACGRTERILSASADTGECIIEELEEAISNFMAEHGL